MPSPPRTFTPAELGNLSLADYAALSPADARAYDLALWTMWEANEASWMAGDYDLVASNRRFELGE